MRLPTLPSSLLELSVSPRSDPPGAPAALQTLRREVISSLRRSAEARGRPKRQLFAVDEELSASFLADLQLETCAPLRDALAEADAHPALAGVRGGSDRGGSAPATDLRAFVVEVSDGVRANPLLVELLVQLLRRAERSNRSLLSANDDSEIYRLVHYSITLDRITRTLAADAEVAAAVFSTLKCAVRADGRWWRHLSPFEHAKLLTVELTLQNFVAARREERIAPSFGHIGLPFNILEAVLEDLRFGHGDNAAAGLALMRARPGQSEPGQAEASLSDDGRRAVRIHLPQAERSMEASLCVVEHGIHFHLRRLAILCRGAPRAIRPRRVALGIHLPPRVCAAPAHGGHDSAADGVGCVHLDGACALATRLEAPGSHRGVGEAQQGGREALSDAQGARDATCWADCGRLPLDQLRLPSRQWARGACEQAARAQLEGLGHRETEGCLRKAVEQRRGQLVAFP